MSCDGPVLVHGPAGAGLGDATTGRLVGGGVGEADGVTGEADGEADSEGDGEVPPLGLDAAPASWSASA